MRSLVVHLLIQSYTRWSSRYHNSLLRHPREPLSNSLRGCGESCFLTRLIAAVGSSGPLILASELQTVQNGGQSASAFLVVPHLEALLRGTFAEIQQRLASIIDWRNTMTFSYCVEPYLVGSRCEPAILAIYLDFLSNIESCSCPNRCSHKGCDEELQTRTFNIVTSSTERIQ
jgi:hypothetical protein